MKVTVFFLALGVNFLTYAAAAQLPPELHD
jgi:hypothetical protein